jgi:hypothetical protein
MHAPEVANLRMAALALHALSADDLPRVWSRLDEHSRSTLGPLLDELKELGIPNGRQWLAADTNADAAAETRVPIDDRALRAKAWCLRPQQVLSTLSMQSVDTAACVLQIAPWPWRTEVIDSYPPEQRHALRERLEAPQRVPERLADQMLQLLISACQNQPSLLAQETKARTVRRPWYHGVMSLFMLT